MTCMCRTPFPPCTHTCACICRIQVHIISRARTHMNTRTHVQESGVSFRKEQLQQLTDYVCKLDTR